MKTLKDQSGIVSIFVTMLLIVIMSLLVLAFAQVSRREQRESLDNQLSTQAYYAAETGINDAKSAIVNFMNDPANAGKDLPTRQTCDDGTNYAELNQATNKNLSTDGSVGYTCVTVDPNPTYLSTAVGDDAQVMPIKMKDGAAPGTLTFTWTGTNGGTVPTPAQKAACANSNAFPVNTTGCPFGGLRIDLVPADSLSRDALNNKTMTVFVMPRKTDGTGLAIPYLTSGKTTQGLVYDANGCMTTGTCTFQINGLNVHEGYYMRVSRLYMSTARLTITDSNREFKDSQGVIDSTGKAQDVLRRVLVSVPLQSTTTTTPGSPLISGDSVCKRFEVYDGFITQGFTGTFPGSGGNPLCQQVSLSAVNPNPLCREGYDIVLVTDSSSSMIGTKWGTYPTREAELINVAHIFAQKIFSNPDNRVALVSFYNMAYTLTSPNFVSTTAQLTSAIDSITNAGGTNYTAALDMADDLISSTTSANARKAIIFLSDGHPDLGGTDAQIQTQANTLNARGIEIYTILINNNDPAAAQLLQQMASRPTGTFYRDAKTTDDFEAYFGSTLANAFPCST